MTDPDEQNRVVAIHVAKARRLPTRSVDSVEAEAGAGLVGDRYHGTKHRHVTLQSAADLAAASAALGLTLDPGATRRNVTVSGPVPTAPGTRVRIGEVELEVVRKAAPCRLLDDWIAPGAMAALHERGGAVCRLLTSGTIRVGDAVLVEEAAAYSARTMSTDTSTAASVPRFSSQCRVPLSSGQPRPGP